MLQQVSPKRGNASREQGIFILSRILRRYHAFIAGGYARWVLSPHKDCAPPGDIDIYFEREEDQYGMEMALDRMGARREYSTANAIAFSHHFFPLPLHLVRVNYGTPENILNSFDFGVCQAALIGNEGYVFPSFLEEEERRELRIKTINGTSLNRVMRYVSRGYWISKEERKKAKAKLHPSYLPVKEDKNENRR